MCVWGGGSGEESGRESNVLLLLAENQVEIMESVRGKDVFIIQTGSGRLEDEESDERWRRL